MYFIFILKCLIFSVNLRVMVVVEDTAEGTMEAMMKATN